MNIKHAGPAAAAGNDKFESHHRQQLSSLMDGELGCDEARFMLRRLEHDPELAACQERWTLLGDVLRGQACAPAPLDFSARVRDAVAVDSASHGAPVTAPVPARRQGWTLWGGGAALAASVAALAMFIGRGQLPDPSDPLPQTVIASTAELPAPAMGEAPDAPAVPSGSVEADAALAAVAVPAAAIAASRRQDANARGSATRTRQAARASERAQAPVQQAIAGQQPMTPSMPASGLRTDPFGREAAPLQARPWPRSTVPSGEGVFNASLPGAASAPFYPFEPRLAEPRLSEPRFSEPESPQRALPERD